MAPPPWIQAGALLLVGLVGLLFALATLLVWRNGYARGWRSSRLTPPTCPKCGYRLSGLVRTKCPECGEEPTLDELWAAVIHRRGSTRE